MTHAPRPTSDPAVPPTPAAWMALPSDEVARYVAPANVALLVGLDGTRRWTYLHYPESRTDWEQYAALLARGILAMVARCFALGVQTVLIPALYPPNFERGEQWLRASLGPHGMLRLIDHEHQEVYRQWDVKVRLGGTWRQAQPWAAEMLAELNQRLQALTPTGQRLLIWECDAGDTFKALFQVAATLGPDPQAVHDYFYPDGPQKLHLGIIGGCLRNFSFISPLLLDEIDFYGLSNLTLDLSDAQLRAILYDYLFQRCLTPGDNQEYSEDFMAAYDHWYHDRPHRVLGLGEKAPGNIWSGAGGIEALHFPSIIEPPPGSEQL